MHELCLAGCTPAPLASYLKSLAVLRLVARQADPEARGWWAADVFTLRSRLDADDLVEFFLDRYSPTPVVSPWNGGSGFHPKDQRAALERIECDGSVRLAPYRETISAARAALASATAEDARKAKAALVARCRAAFPDPALEWLDAALVLTSDGLGFPPLLLGGGIDGHLEFSNNFMQRLCDVVHELAPADAGLRERSASWLRAALLGEPSPQLREAAVGMFSPGATGGANATAGFEGVSLVNPWDFVLMIEGTILFAGAAARRLAGGGSKATATFPFTVESATAGVALGASPAERPRAEVWLPLWSAPSGLADVEHLCAEGRAEWRGRQARDAVEFVQAVAALGVARGVEDFERFAIQKRRGDSHIATPVGRVRVRHHREVDLLAEVDWWLRRFRDRVGDSAPAGLREHKRRLEQAIYDLCLRGGRRATRRVLLELGRAEMALARREALARDVPALELPDNWLRASSDGSAGFRLAAALGSVGAGTDRPVRANLEPVAVMRGRLERRGSGPVIVPAAAADRLLAGLLQRRLLDAEIAGDPRLAFRARLTARLRDVHALFDGRASADEVAGLLPAMSVVAWPDVREDDTAPERLPASLPRAYALLKLCCLPFGFEHGGTRVDVPIEPGILAALAAGNVREAVRRAAVRLRGSGLRLHGAASSPELADGLDHQLLLAALLVPISRGAAATLAASVSIHHATEVFA